jgi:hypothetical protein
MSNIDPLAAPERGVGRASARGRRLLGVALCLCLASPALAAEATKTSPKTSAKTTQAQTTQPKKAPAQPRKAAPAEAAVPRLSAAEVVKRHVSARGGGAAWRSVQTLSASGKMDAGTGDSVERSTRVAKGTGTEVKRERREIAAGNARAAAEKQVQLPFKLARQRPNKSRLEIAFAGKTAVQVYDGTNGWKLRPFLNRNDVEPFTPQEAKTEAESDDLSGPLVDSAAKGTQVALEGVEPVEGRAAYKLKLTARDGAVRLVWIDAKTFLDVKVEGLPRRMDGTLHRVFVFQRDFRAVQGGVKIPFLVETVVDGYPQSHKIVLDKVAVNPKLDPATFAKPKAS